MQMEDSLNNFSTTMSASLSERNLMESVFTSPFHGDWPTSQTDILGALKLGHISDQPLQAVTICFKNDESYVIEAGEGKNFGLAFFAYCAKRYGPTSGASMFPIIMPMIVEAILYFGLELWNDTAKNHLSIIPFRRALTGESVGFIVQYEGDSNLTSTKGEHHA